MLHVMRKRVPDRWSPVGRTLHQDYYTPREPGGDGVYRWGRTVDPDGNTRDRLSDAERRKWLDDMSDEIDWLSGLPCSAVVDVGCGPGWLLRALPLTWAKVGVETSDEAIADVKRHGIACVRGTDELPAGTFDVVVCYHVIEHMRDPERELCQMRRLLRKGGWLLLGTPDFHSPCAVRFGDKYRMLHDPTHISLFTLESMHRFLSDYGFTVRDVQFPFPQRYATPETFMRWNDTTQVSPPWPGNWMTFYAQR